MDASAREKDRTSQSNIPHKEVKEVPVKNNHDLCLIMTLLHEEKID